MDLKFIVDTQLPPILATYLQEKGIDAIHTTFFPDGHLLADAQISLIALQEDRIVITKDSDFPDAFFLKGPPPRVIHIRLGNIRNRDLLDFLEPRWPLLCDLLVADSGMVVINREQIISY
ncbi:MAG: hypothetical protein EAZ91_10445 [Cytophagales bacterium]|nr:MAG: hypothetical protein EAZ91_10445 [Cytophagales bacterium]